jgi:hypothetical protein
MSLALWPLAIERRQATPAFRPGGLKGAQTVGEGEVRGGKVRTRPVSPHDLCATLYQVLGIPLGTHYVDASGRPVSIVGPGKPIQELL